MWTDAAADAARCPGSGIEGSAAAPLANGFPHGRALCPRCLRFVGLDADGRLIEHETTDADESDDELRQRQEWINLHGW